MAKYQAYAEYKDSGVEWLGVVPSHWIITTLKRYCYVKGGFAFSSDAFIDTGYPVIRIGDIKTDGSINLENCKYIPESLAVNSRDYLVEKNQLLMAMTGATIGKAGLYTSNQPAFLNQRVGKFELLAQNMNYRYLWYILKTDGYQEYIKLTAFGGAQPNISDTAMVDYPATIPSFDEQTQIANFLDHETAKIDHLIEKQQQLIELLKEKRQAVISHAVTKGLNPNVPMKDSGVEWLGKVPEHWNVIAISKITNKITNGYVGPTRDILVPEGVPYVQATHIKKGKVNFDNAYFVREKWSNEHAKSILKQGDVLIVQTGAGTGDIGLVSANEEGFNCHALIILQSKQNLMIGSYLAYVLQSDYGYSTLYSIRTGGMHPHLNCGEVQFVKVPVPSCDEQEQIVKFIAKHLERYDLLIQKQEKAIQLMQERRTALISAAVTGKIDVRNWQAPTVGADTELSA